MKRQWSLLVVVFRLNPNFWTEIKWPCPRFGGGRSFKDNFKGKLFRARHECPSIGGGRRIQSPSFSGFTVLNKYFPENEYFFLSLNNLPKK